MESRRTEGEAGVERRTYLVPVDGSAGRDIALLHAIAAARRCGGLVYVLGVTLVPPSLPLDDVEAIVDERAHAAVQNARALAWQYRCPVRTQHVRTRNLAAAIVRAAHEVGADGLFLPPCRSLPRWLRPLIAPSTWRITRAAPCPVYLGPCEDLEPSDLESLAS
jgi:hypothetical protein